MSADISNQATLTLNALTQTRSRAPVLEVAEARALKVPARAISHHRPHPDRGAPDRGAKEQTHASAPFASPLELPSLRGGRKLTDFGWETAVSKLEARIEKVGLKIDTEIASADAELEKFATKRLEGLERLSKKIERYDLQSPELYDTRLDALRTELAAMKAELTQIITPTQPPETEYSAAQFDGQDEVVVIIDTGWNSNFIGPDEDILFE